MKKINFFSEYLNELYGNKTIKIPKYILYDICKKIGIEVKNIDFISSGKFGNAYSINDNMVIKITTDKNEAKLIHDNINIDNESIVKYYGVYIIKYKNQILYVILMDKVETLIDYINNNIKYKDEIIQFTDYITDILWENWNNLNYEEYIKKIKQEYNYNSGFSKLMVKNMWKLYTDVSSFPKLDLHIYNLGITKDKKIIIFDISSYKLTNKFNAPKIIK